MSKNAPFLGGDIHQAVLQIGRKDPVSMWAIFALSNLTLFETKK
jgi:hypothetical protein